jgi:acyl-CoA synthetase (AMP-forming)/AMP-acid ligase II
VCGDQRLTYGALDERASRAAHALTALGVGPGDHVGLFLYNCTEYVEVTFGCFKIRAVPLNLNYRYTATELNEVCADGDVVALIYDDDLQPVVDAMAVRPRVVLSRTAFGDARDAASAQRSFAPRSGADHYILYTGGTTGRPKGVVWRQDDIFFAALGAGNPGGEPIASPDDIGASAAAARGQRVRPYLAPDDPGPDVFVAMALGPLVHAGGQWLAFGTLLGGGRAVLYADRHFRAERVLELIEQERLTMISVVGDATARPLVECLEAAPDAYDVSSLLMVGSGGAMLSADVKARLLAAFPRLLVVLEAIGSSEAPVQAVSIATQSVAPGASLQFNSREQTMVVDDDFRPLPVGKPGRLATRGRVPLGYYKDAAKSDATFVTIDGARWTLPGDMAVVDNDGTIRLLGRGSLCINTGGEKVYPEEVEAVVKSHPGVADAVIVGVPDETWGEQIVAVVAPTDGTAAPALDELQSHCRQQLAGYKVPRAMRVVDAVERSPAGKPDYEWARQVAR